MNISSINITNMTTTQHGFNRQILQYIHINTVQWLVSYSACSTLTAAGGGFIWSVVFALWGQNNPTAS